MDMRELYEKVGGDYDDFLKRIPKADLMEKFARKYTESENYNELLLAYEEKDYQKVFEITHNLKGMAGNISFFRMRDTISKICEAVRNGEPSEDIGPLVKEAVAQHEELKELITHLDS